jgi:cyclohexanone monooxygenase
MIVSVEQHVDWVGDCIADLDRRGVRLIEAEPDAEDAWVLHVNEVAHRTLMVKANSWYMGANVPGKPRLFMPYAGGFGTYRLKCQDVVAKGYEVSA